MSQGDFALIPLIVEFETNRSHHSMSTTPSSPYSPQAQAPVDICSEIDRFRQKLLDLRLSNRLLNYEARRSKAMIPIIDELPNNIFNWLVVQQKPLTFLPKTVEGNRIFSSKRDVNAQPVLATLQELNGRFSELPWQPAANAPLARRHTDDRLQTDLPEDKLESVLRLMRQKAQSAIEETGVNYLCLALGILEWSEHDTSSRMLHAPLLLIPVQLECTLESQTRRYRVSLSYTGEDIQCNSCLAKRLERDFDFVLPEYVDDEGTLLAPEDYFARVVESIKSMPKWRVRREASIDFFSFQKHLMYVDLDPQKWKGEKSLENHPLVRALVLGTQAEESQIAASRIFASDYEIDDNPVAQHIALVKDADGSQHSALCDIAEGKSLVIEGPPGTGKSQTITNAIAHALSEGKSVLFVSEKLAALKVVRSNLEKANLGPFCLELHSEAAKASEVFADLQRRLDATFSDPRELPGIRSRVETLKTKLKTHLNDCSFPTGPSGKPLYEVFWRISELRSRGAAFLDAKIDLAMDESAYCDSIAMLRELAKFCDELGPPEACPWRGWFADQLPLTDPRTVKNSLARLHEIACQSSTVEAELRERFGGEPGEWVQIAIRAPHDFSSKALPPKGFDNTFARTILDISLCQLASEAAREVRAAKASWQAAKALFVCDASSAVKGAEVIVRELAHYTQPSFRQLSLSEVNKAKSQLDSTLRAFEKFLTHEKKLLVLGFGPIGSFREFETAAYRYRLVSHPAVRPPRNIAECHFKAAALIAFKKARKFAEGIDQQISDICKSVDISKAPDDDVISKCIETLRAFGGSWKRWISKQYREAKSLIRHFAKPAARRSTDLDWIKILEDIRDIRPKLRTFEKQSELKRMLGDGFVGMNTDWTALKQSLDWVATAKRIGLSYSESTALRDARWRSREAPAAGDVLAAGNELRQELSQKPLSFFLGLWPESLHYSPLDKIKLFCDAMAKRVTILAQFRPLFSAKDDATVSDLISDAEQVQAAFGEARRLAKHEAYAAAFPGVYQGIKTDDALLSATSLWLTRMREAAIPEDAIKRIVGNDLVHQMEQLGAGLARIKQHQLEWSKIRESLARFGAMDAGWLTFPGSGDDPVGKQLLEQLLADLPRLDLWAGLCRAIGRCRAMGLRDFSEAVLVGKLKAAEAADSFDLVLHEQIVAECFERNPRLRNFSRHEVEQNREDFRRLDRQLIELSQQEIARRAAAHKPLDGITVGRVSELTEMGLIRHEVGKQQRHCHIRDLLMRAGESVKALKPCFMMSPFSIAQFLPPGSFVFDLVVMDEASQIKPEDALGTVMRAKQIVVVGDPKQLPPSSFFDSTFEADEAEENTFLDNTESILEVALKAFPHRRRLRWHYRSQHQSLIAFSNEKFYDSDLIIFPSPTTDAGQLGLRYHEVVNGQTLGGANSAEADAIANAIIRHAFERPQETLGVVAFNIKQAQAIRDRLEKIISMQSDAQIALERLTNNEGPLFIKNLENVQGDERDVIFISYTYGPDPATGRVMNRFGPINSEYGWRRLNVLITRARRRVEVFSSMSPADIKAGPDKSRGLNAMRDYLQYAKTGMLVERGINTGREPQSPFEVSVARVLEGKGLKVVPQVGVAGYFLDIGVVHPESPGDFLLGVECDGAMYHSSKSARDRDRLREDLIKARGWKIHRVWSTDWFLNQAAEEQRLLAAVTEALKTTT